MFEPLPGIFQQVEAKIGGVQRKVREIANQRLHMLDRSIHEPERKQSELRGQSNEELIGTGKAVIPAETLLAALGQRAQAFGRRVLDIDPEKFVVVAVLFDDQVHQRIVLAAVAADDPGAVAAGVIEQWFDVLLVVPQFFVAVEQGKTVALAVEMEHRFVRQVAQFQIRRHGQVVDGGKFVEYRATAGDQRIEIGGQDAVHVTRRHQGANTDMRPVKFCAVDIAAQQFALRPRWKDRHAVAISRLHEFGVPLLCALQRPVVVIAQIGSAGLAARFADIRNDARCTFDAGGDGAAGANQKCAFFLAIAGAAHSGGDTFDGVLHYCSPLELFCLHLARRGVCGQLSSL